MNNKDFKHTCDCNNHPCEHCDMECRFDAEFSNRGFSPGSKEQFIAFIESEVSLAYQRGREDAVAGCINILADYDDGDHAVDSLEQDFLNSIK